MSESIPIAFEKKNFNYSKWTESLFSEVVTTTGAGTLIFLAGIGAEDDETGGVHCKGDFIGQCRLMYKKVAALLERHGATMGDVVKQVTYVTDARYRPQATECRREAYKEGPLPPHTFLNVSQLAFEEMLVEIDIIAAIPVERKASVGSLPDIAGSSG